PGRAAGAVSRYLRGADPPLVPTVVQHEADPTFAEVRAFGPSMRSERDLTSRPAEQQLGLARTRPTVHSPLDHDWGSRRMATNVLRTVLRAAAMAAIVTAGVASSAGPARADALLDEIVGFTGQVFIIDTKVPAVVIAAIRDAETSVKGFGERA